MSVPLQLFVITAVIRIWNCNSYPTPDNMLIQWPHNIIQTIDGKVSETLDEANLFDAPFLKDATDDQKQSFQALLKENENSLKHDLEVLMDAWAVQQGGLLAAQYFEFKKNARLAENLFATAVRNARICDEAKWALKRILEIERNDGISLVGEKLQSEALINSLNPRAQDDLSLFLRDNRQAKNGEEKVRRTASTLPTSTLNSASSSTSAPAPAFHSEDKNSSSSASLNLQRATEGGTPVTNLNAITKVLSSHGVAGLPTSVSGNPAIIYLLCNTSAGGSSPDLKTRELSTTKAATAETNEPSAVTTAGAKEPKYTVVSTTAASAGVQRVQGPNQEVNLKNTSMPENKKQTVVVLGPEKPNATEHIPNNQENKETGVTLIPSTNKTEKQSSSELSPDKTNVSTQSPSKQENKQTEVTQIQQPNEIEKQRSSLPVLEESNVTVQKPSDQQSNQTEVTATPPPNKSEKQRSSVQVPEKTDVTEQSPSTHKKKETEVTQTPSNKAEKQSSFAPNPETPNMTEQKPSKEENKGKWVTQISPLEVDQERLINASTNGKIKGCIPCQILFYNLVAETVTREPML